MQSRQLLGSVVDDPAPRRLGGAPLLPQIRSAPSPTTGTGRSLASPLFGLPRSSPGAANGSRSRASTFPTELDNASITLTLIAGRPGQFTLLDGSGRTSPPGRSASPCPGTWPRPAGDGHGHRLRPGTAGPPGHRVPPSGRRPGPRRPRRWPARSSSPRRGSTPGVIRVSMIVGRPRPRRRRPQHLRPAYLRHNVEKRSAEAERTLQFLDTQIPILRDNLQAAEDGAREVQVDGGDRGSGPHARHHLHAAALRGTRAAPLRDGAAAQGAAPPVHADPPGHPGAEREGGLPPRRAGRGEPADLPAARGRVGVAPAEARRGGGDRPLPHAPQPLPGAQDHEERPHRQRPHPRPGRHARGARQPQAGREGRLRPRRRPPRRHPPRHRPEVPPPGAPGPLRGRTRLRPHRPRQHPPQRAAGRPREGAQGAAGAPASRSSPSPTPPTWRRRASARSAPRSSSPSWTRPTRSSPSAAPARAWASPSSP